MSMGDKPEIPAGWEERVSGESGNVYYFNTYAPVGTPKSEFGRSGTRWGSSGGRKKGMV